MSPHKDPVSRQLRIYSPLWWIVMMVCRYPHSPVVRGIALQELDLMLGDVSEWLWIYYIGFAWIMVELCIYYK